MKRNKEVLKRLRADANKPKEILIDIEWELRESGFVREANSLCTIIEKLEIWQNK